MGMSTHIEGFIPDTDAEFQRHKKVLLVCAEANVTLPPETAKYFGSKYSDESLLDEKLNVMLEDGVHYTQYRDSGCSGFEVDLTRLPKGVTKLRFYNSY
jgi:hypothetical protein